MDTHSKLEFNEHHLVFRSEGGTNNERNKVTMKVRRHDALHSLFPQMLPQEQLKALYSLNKQVFVPDVCEIFENAINEIVKEDPKYVLVKGVYVPYRR